MGCDCAIAGIRAVDSIELEEFARAAVAATANAGVLDFYYPRPRGRLSSGCYRARGLVFFTPLRANAALSANNRRVS